MPRRRASRICSKTETCCAPAQLAERAVRRRTAGAGGKIQEFSWNGELVWDFTFGRAPSAAPRPTRLPNGNVLLIVEEKKTAAEAIAAGRIPASVEGSEAACRRLIEIKPTGKTSGEIVWDWRLWDHLIQDHDKEKANFGDVAAHPERVDVNFTVTPGRRSSADWTHFNSVAYNADLDQVIVSLRNFSEIWIIDHSTTTKEAAGRTGRQARQGRRPSLSLGQSARVPRRYRRRSAPVRAAQRALDSERPPGRRPPPHLQQRRRAAGGPVLDRRRVVLPVDGRGVTRSQPGGSTAPERASGPTPRRTRQTSTRSTSPARCACRTATRSSAPVRPASSSRSRRRRRSFWQQPAGVR